MTLTQEPDLELLELEGSPAAVIRPKKWRNPDAGRRVRRGLPIHGYFGANGNGKSLLVVHDTLPDLDAGDPVLSTMRLINADTGDDYPNYIPWTDWDQVLDLKKGSVIADEIVGVAGSRNSMSLPIEVQNLLNQLRRGDMRFSWDAPSWARADLIIRETSQGATLCRASQLFGVQKVSDADGRERTWRQHTVFRFKTYDAQKFEAWTAAKESGSKKLRPLVTASFRSAGTRAQASYDTFAPVNRVGLDLDSGRCASCGGVRRPKPCSCDRASSPRPGRSALGGAERSGVVFTQSAPDGPPDQRVQQPEAEHGGGRHQGQGYDHRDRSAREGSADIHAVSLPAGQRPVYPRDRVTPT